MEEWAGLRLPPTPVVILPALPCGDQGHPQMPFRLAEGKGPAGSRGEGSRKPERQTPLTESLLSNPLQGGCYQAEKRNKP